jgi:uracil-DNA glycosylase
VGRGHARKEDIEEAVAAAAPAQAADAGDLRSVRSAAADCHACELWRLGTQTVFGEGPANADLMLVGEQPGDREDLEGHPFVGPAGRVLDRALADAGIDHDRVYVTNVVKHFRWTPRGKRRIHQRPAAEHIRACRPWLDAELRLVRPRILVCLGATAAQALIGPSFRVSTDRGVPVPSPLAPIVFATVHPSSILRARDESRDREYDAFVRDLSAVADAARRA